MKHYELVLSSVKRRMDDAGPMYAEVSPAYRGWRMELTIRRLKMDLWLARRRITLSSFMRRWGIWSWLGRSRLGWRFNSAACRCSSMDADADDSIYASIPKTSFRLIGPLSLLCVHKVSQACILLVHIPRLALSNPIIKHIASWSVRPV